MNILKSLGRKSSLLAFATAVVMAAAASAPAQDIHIVLNADDSGPGSLRTAIAEAASGDVIVFDDSLRGETITLTGNALFIDKTLDIVGPGAEDLAISGDGWRVFEVAAGKPGKNKITVTISGLTIRDGAAYSFDGHSGGGAISNAGDLKIKDCILTRNHANLHGGGIYNSGTLTVSGCDFFENWVHDAGGSGGGGSICNRGTATVTNSVFAENDVSGTSTWGPGFGGGILNYNSMTVSGCVFLGNFAAKEGGGIMNNELGKMTVKDCGFFYNYSQQGGGIMNRGTLTISGCTFSDNWRGDVVNTGTVKEPKGGGPKK
jgi:hypothetical protein